MTQNPNSKKRNPKSLANLRPPFDGSKPGPGRPRESDELKRDRRDAKQILYDNSARAARRLSELVGHHDPDVAIKASDGILKRTVPVLEEVTNKDERPLNHIPDDQLAKALNAVRLAAANGRPSGNGHSNGNGAPA